MRNLAAVGTGLIFAFALSACMQSEVIKEESSYSFGKQWNQQLGDTDKMRSKFASGFEIKNGRAVATGSDEGKRKRQRTKKIKVDGETYEIPRNNVVKPDKAGLFGNKKKEDDGNEAFLTKKFSGSKSLERETYSAVKDSPDSEKESFLSRMKTKDRDDRFRTSEFAGADSKYTTKSATGLDSEYRTSESNLADDKFYFSGNGREARESGNSTNARATLDRMDLSEEGVKSRGKMSIDEVRQMLSPETFD